MTDTTPTEEVSTTVDTEHLSPMGDTEEVSTVVDTDETFPRSYVEKLRDESARYRQRAQQADAFAERLLETTVRSAAVDVLADPGDLMLHTQPEDLTDDDGFPDADAIVAAARTLAQERPHLANRRPRGQIGQGATTDTEGVNLAAILRGRAS